MKELSVKESRFWDLLVQKHLRNFASFKLLIFMFILIPSIWLLNSDKMSGTNFATIVTGGLAVIAVGRVYEKVALMHESNETDLAEEYPEVKRTIKKAIEERYRE